MTFRKLLAAASSAVMITAIALGLDTNSSATDKYEVIYSFNGMEGGVGPLGLISDAAGNLYGTTQSTFTNGGVVFKLSNRHSGRVLSSPRCVRLGGHKAPLQSSSAL